MEMWDKFVSAVGKNEVSPEFLEVQSAIGEVPNILSDPAAYNDPVGKTKYYKFIRSGIEVGFRGGVLNHVHLYLEDGEGYSAFKGGLFCGLSSLSTHQSVLELLGDPLAAGGGKTDSLIGYIGKWMRYETQGVSVNLQFNKRDVLYRVAIIQS